MENENGKRDPSCQNSNFGNDVKTIEPDQGRVYCPTCGESGKLTTTQGVLDDKQEHLKPLRCMDCNEDFYLDVSKIVAQSQMPQANSPEQAQVIPMKKNKLDDHWSADKKAKKLKKHGKCAFWVIDRYCQNKGYPWCQEHLDLMKAQGINPPPMP